MDKRGYRISFQWTGLASAGVALLALAKMAVLTRWLDSADFGLMALVTFALGVMDLFSDMGLGTALVHKRALDKRAFTGVFLLMLGLSLLLWLLSFPLGKAMGLFYGMEALGQLIPLAALGLLLSAPGSPCKILEQKDLDFKGISAVTLGAAVGSFVLSVVLAMRGLGVYALVYGLLFLQGAKSLGFLWLRRRKGRVFAWPDFVGAADLAKVGFWHFGGQLINSINRDFDILLLGKFFSAEVLGGYSLAKELAKKPAQWIFPSLLSVMAPALAARESAEAMAGDYVRMLRAVASVFMPLHLGLALSAPVLIPLLYGAQYQEVVLTFAILCGMMGLRGPMGTVGQLVVATGKTRVEFFWNVGSVLLTPALVFLGLQGGREGVALALLLNLLLLFYPAWFYLVKRLAPIDWKEYRAAFFEWGKGWKLLLSVIFAKG